MNASRWALALVVAGAAFACWPWSRGTDRFPRPVGEQPGEAGDTDFSARRAAYFASLHRTAPGVDWRAQDARFRSSRLDRLMRDRDATLAAGAVHDPRRVDVAALSGSWIERGSSNQAGRVLQAMHDQQNDRLVVLTHGGNIWRADRATLNWAVKNESEHFDPAFFNFGFAERLGGVSGERLLVSSESPRGLFRSDDGGTTWTAATGLTLTNPFYAMGLAARDPSFADVYYLRTDYDVSQSRHRPVLFASSDRGASFTKLGFVGQRDRTSIFSPRYISSEVFVLADAQLMRIVPGTNVLANVSTVPVAALADGDKVILRGGFANGQVFLYAFYQRGGAGTTEVYRSLDGGATWAARTAAPTYLFCLNSAETSPRDPNFVYAGGINMVRSADGGATWSVVNDWTQYYGSPATKLHADIDSIQVYIDGSNVERVYVGTDGGLFESTDNAVTMTNVTSSGLRDSQYYGSYTVRTPPYAIVTGAQDQGYQKSIAPGAGVLTFQQAISGDYAHLASGNNGASIWMVYPGFAQVDTTPGVGGQGGLRTWDFGGNSFTGWLFLPPLAADPANANRVSLGGGTTTGAGHGVVQLTLSGGTISGAQDAFDFGSVVTAVAYSPVIVGERYAINDAGKFFRDTGTGWTQRASGMPSGQYFYGNAILADPVVGAKIYVGGAGYSNPGVYVSIDDGATFQPMSTGLPSTLVYGLAASPDGTKLFAATEVGAFYYDPAQAKWIDLTSLGAPDQIYWDVDYVPALNVARFSTYGRGIWDFAVTTAPDALFANGFE